MAHVQIFLSTVTAEFRSYRDALRHDLDRPNVTVKVQEDFIATGTETLDKLDEYIRHCDAVIHLVGDMTGALAKPSSLAAIRQRCPDLAQRLPVLLPFLQPDAPALSYTQWEAWLALYHGKVLIIAKPQDGAPRDANFKSNNDQRDAQQAHLDRLRSAGRYPEIHFANSDRLAVDMLRSKLHDILARAGPMTKPANLPYISIGDLFKGRDPTLKKLTKSFGRVSDSIVAPVVARVVNGLGGIGKTRVAVEYAWRRAREYKAIFFVGGDSPDALQRNLAGLCSRTVLDLPEQTETDEAKQRDAVVVWLKQNPGWLLILDNIDSEDSAAAVETLLPQLTGGHILLTSRLANWGGGLIPLTLGELSSDAATKFLLERTESRRRPQADDPAAALTLAKELGFLALALEQAGAYIVQRRLSFKRYLEEWQGQRDNVLAWFDPRLMQYPASVAVTWQTSFDRLSARTRRLMQRLAWLAPEPIPESLLEVPVPNADATDANTFHGLTEMESYSLVTRAVDSPSFNVHRLVQEVTRRSQRDDPMNTVLAETLRWIDAACVGDAQDVRNWPVFEPLAPHARVVTAHADAAGIADPTAHLLNQVAALLHRKALYGEAEPLYQCSLKISEKSLGPEHSEVATSLNNLAVVYRAQGKYVEAEPLLQRSLTIREKSVGPEHPKVARSLNNLAALYDAQGKYAEAEPLYQRSLTILEKSLGPEHPEVATSLNNLAALYDAQGKYAEAEPLYQRSLTILEKSLGPEHPEVATSLNNLAGLYDAQGKPAKAETLYQRSLKIREKSLGPEHPQVATSLNNLAVLYRAQGKYAKAEPLFQRSLKIFEKSLGPEHPDVATSLSNLAMLYRAQVKYAEAEHLFQRSLKISEKCFGPEHPNVATALENCAEVLGKTGRTMEASQLATRAQTIRQKR